ncbi:cysteine--tRNA ligase [Ruminococcaceae bacterium OttesenSCG-928-D13]|nr:cysteine--tRNA ligase [Ruminococcaceae bacterium OttesenSCG-928-D13]
MLTFPESEIDLRERSPLALAFVGDGVIELLVRARLVAESRMPAGALHRSAVEMVSARGQFAALHLLEPMLTEQEADIVRRGRNASKATVSKNASAEEYRASTGLEALFGWLYLQNRLERVEELFEPIWQRHLEMK